MIDRVYKTVQDLLNKEQRGYLPPSEFNNFAHQAQTEIFELYFHDYNFFENAEKMGRTNSEYANLPMHFRERISRLNVTGTGTIANGVVTLPDSLYRLIMVTTPTTQIPIEEEHKDVNPYAQLSPLAKSTSSRPTYLRIGNTLELTPADLTGDVNLSYIRKPNAPKWGYVTVNDEPFYESSRSIDFDIHPADEAELVVKILMYAGIAVKADDVVVATEKLMAADVKLENNV